MLHRHEEFMQINAAAIKYEWQYLCGEFNVNIQQWNKEI